jgi:hypothetical protein
MVQITYSKKLKNFKLKLKKVLTCYILYSNIKLYQTSYKTLEVIQMGKKYVIAIEDGEGRYSFHMETEMAKQYMCSAGILEATVYTDLRKVKKVKAETQSKGEYKIVPYHWGLDIGILQQESLIARLYTHKDEEFVEWTREEAIEYYQAELLKMKKLYVLEAPPKCIGCKKTPEMLGEYDTGANAKGETPSQHMVEVEGTYGKFKPNQFYCTSCYVKHGMPLIRH